MDLDLLCACSVFWIIINISSSSSCGSMYICMYVCMHVFIYTIIRVWHLTADKACFQAPLEKKEAAESRNLQQQQPLSGTLRPLPTSELQTRCL